MTDSGWIVVGNLRPIRRCQSENEAGFLRSVSVETWESQNVCETIRDRRGLN
jgi:hypothetical protein